MHTTYTTETCFTIFKEDISNIELPSKFTYPFYYEPHKLCILATNQLQELLLTQKDWHHDFGINSFVEGTNIGKMFGVLVVQKQNGDIGYLSAFSGKISETNHLPGFVPPIFDLLNKEGFFKKEEDLISEINHKIESLTHDAFYLTCKQNHLNNLELSEKELKDFRLFMKKHKDLRKIRRNEGKHKLGQNEFDHLLEELKQESLKHQYDYKQLRKQWNEKINENEENLKSIQKKIDDFKNTRKKRSAALQQKLFNQYQFLNIDGETIGVGEIFANTSLKVPPAGAGECAAPRLFQFAFEHQLKPIAMAEFWWGQSPKSEIRKHKNFYPSCRGKCEPILGHMLKGIPMDENPIQSPTINDDELAVVFEDDDVVVINKPAEFLSIPGKKTEDSVFMRMKQKYPKATGPLLVHRLDMSTSGLLIIAKNKEAHKIIQKQFLDRTIQKRYVALLDGIIEENEGFVNLPLRVDLNDRPRQLVCYEHGKPAKTKFKVIDRKDGKTKVHFFPITGRTHQLRVHAAHPEGLNMPIVGDDLYGIKSSRLHLHAEFLEFTHPTTNKTIRVNVKAEF